MSFTFFKADVPVTSRWRNLPHWEQAAVTYFLTFRTGDSLPAHVVRVWVDIRNKWLQRNGINPHCSDWRKQLRLCDTSLKKEFEKIFSTRMNRILDAGYGECLLRNPSISEIVAGAFHHCDGEHYDLGDFVIMPNHVHVLVQPRVDNSIREQCRAWKNFTAFKINRILGRRGTLWQTESYDHIVRDEEEFIHYRRYIAENPIRANLRSDEFRYYRRPDQS
ncbi:MAG: transposase [Planctomycetes bacterium]|nr:transposase [Planctomycetota bacterium]